MVSIPVNVPRRYIAKKAAEVLTSGFLASKADIHQIKVEIAVIKWMIEFNLAFTMAML